jgi:hypothetical protein
VKLNESGRAKFGGHNWHIDDPEAIKACPYGQVGDRLWVRETWSGREGHELHGCTGTYFYFADGENQFGKQIGFTYMQRERKWRPSIHMPRWASRITLEITSVRVERLRDISESDAKSEGAEPSIVGEDLDYLKFRAGFQTLWESISGPESWDSNPWVWVVEFKRV